MNKDTLIAAALGGVSGLLHVSVLGNAGGAMLLVMMATLPLFLAGLWLGLREGVVAVGAGTVVAGLFLGLQSAGLYALLDGLPFLLLVRQALLWRQEGEEVQWYPAGMLLAWLTGIGIAYAVGAMLVLALNDAFRVAMHEQMLFMLREFPGTTPEDASALAEQFLRLLPAASGGVWMLTLFANAALAQGLLVRFEKNSRPTPSFEGLALPRPFGLAFPVAVMAAFLPGQLGAFALAVTFAMGVAFLLQGIAVIHVLSRLAPNRNIVLIGFYLMLALLFTWLLPLVIFVGLVEQWAGLRRRFAKGPGQEED